MPPAKTSAPALGSSGLSSMIRYRPGVPRRPAPVELGSVVRVDVDDRPVRRHVVDRRRDGERRDRDVGPPEVDASRYSTATATTRQPSGVTSVITSARTTAFCAPPRCDEPPPPAAALPPARGSRPPPGRRRRTASLTASAHPFRRGDTGTPCTCRLAVAPRQHLPRARSCQDASPVAGIHLGIGSTLASRRAGSAPRPAASAATRTSNRAPLGHRSDADAKLRRPWRRPVGGATE